MTTPQPHPTRATVTGFSPPTSRHRGAAALALGLLVTALGCGASNAERPYLDGGAPRPIDPAGRPTGTGGSGTGVGSGGAPGSGGSTPPTAGTPGSPTPDAGLDSAPPRTDTAAPDATSACLPRPLPPCEPDNVPATSRRPWKNFGSSIVAAGTPRHRGRDLFFIDDPAAPQWLIGKFAYGAFDADITGEDVDVYLLRGCGNTWEKLGTATTTRDGEHPETEGADDSGGRVYLQLSAAQRLGPGRHRVRFVVAGDASSADAFIEVLPAGARLVVSDIDGTLTPSETAEFGALLTGQIPAAEPDAARALAALVAKGYRPLYLSARPEWLTGRTREFLTMGGFPLGVLETTTGGSGALGADAEKFKTAALARITAKGLAPGFAIGNTDTDAKAYASANISPAGNRVFLRYTDAVAGGRRIESYADLLRVIEALPAVCP